MHSCAAWPCARQLSARCPAAGMWAPGCVGLVVGFMLLFAVKDSPQKAGFPPVEIVDKKVAPVGLQQGHAMLRSVPMQLCSSMYR